jgi:hypothetical protein
MASPAFPAHVEPEILAFTPSQPPHFLDEGGQRALIFRFSWRSTQEYADAAHAALLLRVRRKRPCRRAPECDDEFSPSKPNPHLPSDARVTYSGRIARSKRAVLNLESGRLPRVGGQFLLWSFGAGRSGASPRCLIAV